MYRVDKDHTPERRYNEVMLALKDFRACLTKDDLKRMFYENFHQDEDGNCGKVLDIEVDAMPIHNGYGFCIDMVIDFDYSFERIHFWVNNENENVYCIENDESLTFRHIFTRQRKF